MFSLPNLKGVTYLVFKAVDSMEAVVKATGKYSRRCLESQIGNFLGRLGS